MQHIELLYLYTGGITDMSYDGHFNLMNVFLMNTNILLWQKKLVKKNVNQIKNDEVIYKSR